ncbi:MAG: hypothetical protein JWM80_5746, partial [Cyanobacteria bacterium RYN_339]|nr:hypothetical protein [Cyanobacteria bacterium RYN_339]
PVWVIPLKQERLSLDVGRNEVEGFYVRFPYDYSLPSLVNGYLTNNGRLQANYFEKKGPAVGIENTTHWGYYATTYGFLYGLITPDRSNLLPVNDARLPDRPASELQALQDKEVKLGNALFGLNGLPFQDHQWGLEHRQHIWGDLEAGGRFEDHNIYDPLTPNYRNNRHITRFDVKDQVPTWGNLSLSAGYDATEQRGTQTRTADSIASTLSQSASQRVNGNASGKLGNTNMRVSSDLSRQHSSSISLKPNGTDGKPDPANPVLDTQDAGGNVNITTNFNASSEWPAGINSNVTVPYRIDFRETPAPSPLPSGAPAPAPSPKDTPTPWNQNIEPTLDVTDRIQGVGTLSLQASKFFDLTQQVASSPVPIAQQIANVKNQGRFDRLPEITLTSEPFLANYQPFTLKLGYGRFFEYSSFNKKWLPEGFTGTLDRYFPGPYINRLNPEATLSSKGQDIGFKSSLDFGGSGYRQFFYSTNDAQYSIDERLRLSTNWTEKIQTNLSYTNNLTPDPKDYDGGGLNTPTNSSPFNQDKLSLYKQTHLTADFNVRNDPYLTYALRGGYDYQNKQYDNLSSEVGLRSALPWLGMPVGLTLNGQFQPEKVTPARIAELKDPNLQEGGLRFESKTFDIRYLPKFPTYGLAGTWLPVTGTFTLRSTPDIFGGAFGSDSILPGWQLDNQMSYDFEKGQWQTLVNRVYFTFGHDWHDHLELMLGGYYDPNPLDRGYKFTTLGLSKDLHDFILSFQYDRLSSFYSISLTMVAFPSKPLNFTSNSFNRNAQPGGSNGIPGLSGF